MTKTPDLLTSAEVCERLDGGIDRSTLSRWVKEGKLTPAVKFPGLRGPMLFTPAEVARFERERAAS